MAGERIKRSISKYITNKLKLKVNDEKSVVCLCVKTMFIGYTIGLDGSLLVAKSSIFRLKEKVRFITKRNRGRKFESIISELNPVLRGWLPYFRIAKCQTLLRNMDAWIRRKLRCYRLKQCKRTITVQRFLHSLGVDKWQSWILHCQEKDSGESLVVLNYIKL